MTQSSGSDSEARPRQTATMSLAEQLSLWGIRAWVGRRMQNQAPCAGFFRAFKLAGAPQAADHLADFMSLLSVTAQRCLEINCPKCPDVTTDEELLIAALTAAQCDGFGAASSLLGKLIVPPAIHGSLLELRRFGRAMSEAGLHFLSDGQGRQLEMSAWDNKAVEHSPDRGAGLIH